MQRTRIAIAISLCIISGAVEASQTVVGPVVFTNHANVTQLDFKGHSACFVGGGMNDVNMNWDGTIFTSSTDYTGLGSISNVTLSTATVACGYMWTAHAVQMFAPGTYTFDTSLGGGVSELVPLTLVVGPNQLGMHMLLDWNGNNNMDIAMVFERNKVFGSGIGNNDPNCTKNCLFTGGPTPANPPAGNHVWGLASVDGNGDGISGITMVAGNPFAGFNFNLNADFVLTPPIDTVADFSAIGIYGLASGVSMQVAPADHFDAPDAASAIIAAAVAGNTPMQLAHQGRKLTAITLWNTTGRGNVLRVDYVGLTAPYPTVTVQTSGGCLPYTQVGPTAGCAPPYGNGNGFSTSDPMNAPVYARLATIALIGGRNIVYAPLCWNGGCGEPQRVKITP